MDRSKLDNQMDRRVEKLDLSIAARSGRKPIEEYDKYFFLADVPYADAIVSAKIILCTKRLSGTFRGVYLDTPGPWILFKVIDIKSGDYYGEISPGAAILAKWDNRLKVYTKYLYKADPKEYDVEVLAMSSLVPATEYEIVSGKSRF